MPVTINGTTGVVTPGATIGSINGILKSSSGVVSQAVAGQDYGQLTLATAQAASGTAVDFTSIPSWVKRITVMFSGVSTNGSSNPLIQIGAGSVTTSGYTARSSYIASGSVSDNAYTTGFGIFGTAPSNTYIGNLILTNVSGNTWVCSSVIGGTATWFSTGVVTLSGTLDRVRITTVGGTDTFDAGTINISYE
jgi:hypothetical protein